MFKGSIALVRSCYIRKCIAGEVCSIIVRFFFCLQRALELYCLSVTIDECPVARQQQFVMWEYPKLDKP